MDDQCLSSMEWCSPVLRGGVGLYRVSQPTAIQMAGDETAARNDVRNHNTMDYSDHVVDIALTK